MCGRYTIEYDKEYLFHRLDQVLPEFGRVDALPPTLRQGEIKPTSYVPIIRFADTVLRFESAHWWLLPPYGQEKVKWSVRDGGEKTFRWPAGGPPGSHFNCRQDTLTIRPYWRDLIVSKRCLFFASSFIEWQDDDLRDMKTDKWGANFRTADHKPFAMAGVYELGQDNEGKPFLSANIVTTAPNELLKSLPHKRMPAILREEELTAWLSPTTTRDEALALLKPFPADEMDAEPFLSKPASTTKKRAND